MLASLGLAAPLWALPPPSLTFSFGPLNPGPQSTGMNGIPFVMQLTVTNNATEFVNLNTLTLQASGSANDAGSSVNLYQDNNLDGIPDAGAIASSTFGSDNGVVVLSFGSVQIGAGVSQTFLIQGNGWTAPGTVVQTLTAASAIGGVSAQTSVNSGLPLASSTLTVLPPQVMVSAGPVNPGPQTVGPVQQVMVLQFTVSNTGLEPVFFNGVDVQASGSADDTNDHLALETDTDQNGVGETTLAGQNYASDNGVLTLACSPLQIQPGQAQTFVLVANSGASTGTMVRGVVAVAANGFYSGYPAQNLGIPLQSAAMTLPPPQVALSFGALNPGPQIVGAASTATFLQFTVSNTGTEAVIMQGLTVQASGTANDGTDGVQLFDDVNQDGVPEGGQGNGNFSGDDGSTAINTSPTLIQPGQSHTFLLQGATGFSSGTLIRGITSVLAVGQFTGAAASTAGAPLNSAAATLPPPQVALSFGPLNPGPQTVGAASTATFLQFTVSNTGTEAVIMQGLTVQASGTANDGTDGVQIFDDVNQDGVPEGGQGNGNFSGDDGSAAIATSPIFIGPGQSHTFLMQGATGFSAGTLVRGITSVLAIGQFTGAAASTAGAPLNSAAATLPPPQVALSFGPLNPGPQTVGAAGTATFLQFTVSNTGTEAVIMQGLTVQASGTAFDGSDGVQLYDDVNQDGVPEGGQGNGNFSGDDGSVAITTSPVFIGPGQSHTFLLQGATGLSVGTLIRGISSVLAMGQFTGVAATTAGAPLNSAAFTVPAPQLALSVGPLNPGPQTVAPSGGTVFLQFTLSNTGTEPVTLQSLTVAASGTANDNGDGVGLFDDVNQDGVPEGSDGAGSFAADNGNVAINTSPIFIGAGQSHTFLLQGPTGLSVGSLIRSISSVTALGQFTGQSALVAPLPLNSAAFTVPPPTLAAAPGPSNPGWNTVTAGSGQQVMVLQFTLTNTGGEPVNITGVKIQGNGTGNETLLGSVKLWQDQGPNGMDGSDLLLDTENYAVDDGLMTMNTSVPLAVGQKLTFLFSYDPGNAVGTHLPSLGGVVANGTITNGSALTGGSVTSGGLLIVAATPTVTPTATPSPVQSATGTGTPTFSPVLTPTNSGTPSATPVVTPTNSWTPSATPVVTPTNTWTPSATPVLTPTNTWTPSATPVLTPTNTWTPSATPVQSPTGTRTATATPVQSPTGTRTATATPVHSATDTPVPTSTRTPSDTPVSTHTLTPVPTHSFTRTYTPTRSPTPVPTVNPNSPTPTSTPSAAAVLSRNLFRPSQGPLGISFKVFKNGPVTVRVFDLSGARVRTAYQSYAATASGWVQAVWDGRNDRGQEVATGLYLVSIQGGGIQRLLKVAVLR